MLLLFECNLRHNYTNQKGKTFQYPESDLLDVKAIAYHPHDSLTQVFIEIKNENLLYKRTDTSNAFFAEIKLTYTLLPEMGSKKILTSATNYIFDKEEAEIVPMKVINDQINLYTKFGNDYLLLIEITDMNRKTRSLLNLNINKHDKLGVQNFLVKQGGLIAFKNNFFANQTVLIQTQNLAIQKLYVNCFTSTIKPALPPFSLKQREDIDLKPDSVFQIDLVDGQTKVEMPEKGFYFIKALQESDVGFCLYTYDVSFPGVKNLDEMIMSCRYIMYKDEYDACMQAAEKKAAIDNFWLSISGSNERAKEVLKKYYARVKAANQKYTSYMQGWKTDRGMIEIIFGQASNIYKSKKDEIWIYGLETNPSALRFIFKKQFNYFSDNDYVLERSGFFKEAYYRAVDYWRQGIVYSEKGLDR